MQILPTPCPDAIYGLSAYLLSDAPYDEKLYLLPLISLMVQAVSPSQIPLLLFQLTNGITSLRIISIFYQNNMQQPWIIQPKNCCAPIFGNAKISGIGLWPTCSAYFGNKNESILQILFMLFFDIIKTPFSIITNKGVR